MCGLTIQGVPNAHRDWHVCVFNREHACRLLPLILIPVRFIIVQDRVWEALRLRPWQLHIYFPYVTRPCLDYVEASSSEGFCAFYSCFKLVFSCLVFVGNDFITIVRVTFSASMPVTAVVLKYSPRFGVVSVNRCAPNPPLAALPTCRVVNVNFPPHRFLFEPAKRFWRTCMFWKEGFLERCLRCFDSFGWTINHRLPLGTRLGMPLKVASLSESCTAMNTCIRSCKLRNILDDERVPLVNSDCQNVSQLGRRVSSKVPFHTSINLALRLINTDTEPIREIVFLIQVSFTPFRFIERCFRAVVWSRSEFKETLTKLSCCRCASIWSCTAVYRNAALETQVVLVGVQR